jgi:hypothetical protein
MRVMPFVLFLLLASCAVAREKPPYEVGIFMSSQQVSDGTYSTASCGSFGCNGSAYNAAHNVHLVSTPDGIFSIEAPVSVAGTFLLGMATNGNSPTVHKAWFMDDLHEGDKVLFSAACNKHNRCTIRLPNPDKPNKEILTLGFFFPAIAKTNTTVLCGTGKLTADVEAQVCAQENPPPPPAAPSPVSPGEQQTPSAAGSGEPLNSYESTGAAAKQKAPETSATPDSPPTFSPETPSPDQSDTEQKVTNEMNAPFHPTSTPISAESTSADANSTPPITPPQPTMKEPETRGGLVERRRQRVIDKAAEKKVAAPTEASMVSRYWGIPEKPITTAPWPEPEKPFTPVEPIKQYWDGKRFVPEFFSGTYGKRHAFAINGPAMAWRGTPFKLHSSFCQSGFCFTLFDSIPSYWFYNELTYAYIDETCIADFDSGDFTCTYFLYNADYPAQRVMIFVVDA